jgi:hypothetical protein
MGIARTCILTRKNDVVYAAHTGHFHFPSAVNDQMLNKNLKKSTY